MPCGGGGRRGSVNSAAESIVYPPYPLPRISLIRLVWRPGDGQVTPCLFVVFAACTIGDNATAIAGLGVVFDICPNGGVNIGGFIGGVVLGQLNSGVVLGLTPSSVAKAS